MEHRFQKTEAKGHGARKVTIHPERLDIPLKRKKPTVWAIWNDLFHEDVPDRFINGVFNTICMGDWHVYLLLTKRILRMRQWVEGWTQPIPENIWAGVTVCNQQEADEKIPILRSIPAAVRFLSVEPLLEQTDLCLSPGMQISAPYGSRGIHWIIVGGESGPGARPMHPDWARSVRDQCQLAEVPFLFKQWGEWLPGSQADTDALQIAIGGCNDGYRWENKTTSWKIGKNRAGHLLNGREWNELPAIK